MLYNYKCAKCGCEFERNLKMDDRLLPTQEACPSCMQYFINKEVNIASFTVNGYSEKNGYSKKTPSK
jgi:putative FmdB family regulatory protein